MNRLLVILLAAFDALLTAAVGLVAALAPLTVLWVVGFGGGADWGSLWPSAARLWQLGHLVPLHVTLPAEYLAVTGIPADAAQFTLSLAPLAFAAASALAGARSGARAARAGEGLFGVASGALVFAAVAAAVRLSSGNAVATIFTWQAVLAPALVFALPALIAAVVVAWRVGDDGVVDALRAKAGGRSAPEAAAIGLGVALAGLVGLGALVVAAGLILRGSEVVALYEAAHVDAIGAVVFTLGELAYLPTLIVWGMAFAAGPGFAIGVGTNVGPTGTSVGVLPGIPILGIVPDGGSAWMLLMVLGVIAVGFFAGWLARRRLGPASTAERFAVLAAIVTTGGAATALLAAVARGSAGPGRLELVGPDPGAVALAVGVELGIGAAIALLTPARLVEDDPHATPAWPDEGVLVGAGIAPREDVAGAAAFDTAPLDVGFDDDHDADAPPRPPVE